MTGLLHDSIWTFVGSITAVVAVLVAVAIYFGQRERKRVFVELITRIPLLAADKLGIEGLKLTFNEERLTNATVHMIRVACIGNRSILAADFESPIRFLISVDPQPRKLLA
jgi:hypothetical protein